MAIRPLAPLVLVFALPLAVSAHEPKHEAVVSTYSTALRAGHQVVATVTCPPGMAVLTGGYKLLNSTVAMRALVVVENRPVLEAGQWMVSLLYDSAAGELPQGNLTLQISALCQPVTRHASPQMGKHDL